jgi:hypothetical protein
MNAEHYVTVNNGQKSTLALGPYLTDMQARYAVKRVREFLEDNDSNANTYEYGTFRVPANGRVCGPGTLNKRIGL